MQDNLAQSPPLNRLAELQDRISRWCGEQFPEQTPTTILRHLEEEARELGDRHTAEEAADCLILLLTWAAHTQGSLIETFSLTDWEGDLAVSATDLLHYEQRGLGNAPGEARYFLAFLLGWSYLSGVDLLAAAEAKHAVNLTRSWRRDADGIHRHVEVQP